MKEKNLEREFEEGYLKQTISIAKDHLAKINAHNEKTKSSIISSKRSIPEDNTYYTSNLWSLENFHDLVELNQNTEHISSRISEYEMEAVKISRLERMINSPYFARIDFKFDDEEDFEKIYIGLSSLIDDSSHEIYVYDWRAPISGIFYRFGTGRAFYDAPLGKIYGELGLKRQYEIKKRHLEYFFDADVQITDEFLRKLLSQNASPKMKTIVETIQKEQDIIIRDMEMDLLMVQGVAGSGKTSVALHRVAYLMYKGLSSKLYPGNIIIISPNILFEQYISNVLPELGESSIDSVTFDSIIQSIFPNTAIQTKNQLLEYLLLHRDKKDIGVSKDSTRFKGSAEYIEILKRFMDDVPSKWIEFTDVYYDGNVMVKRELLKARVVNEKKAARLSLRLKDLEHYILEQLHHKRKKRIKKLRDFAARDIAHEFEIEELARMLSIYESTVLIKEIRKFTEINIFNLYKKLFSDKNYFYNLSWGIALPESIEQIIDSTCKNLNSGCLHHEDALALLYLHLKIYGSSNYKDVKQVIIDEVQDYFPVHFEILNLLFPYSRFTALGDINQTIEKPEKLSLYEQLDKILCKKRSKLITMDKSFRCTSEILEYSKKFLDEKLKMNSFSRSGDLPSVYEAKSTVCLDRMITDEIGDCMDKNYQSIALICKTEEDSLLLYKRLKDKIDIHLIKNEGKTDLNGIFVIPVYLSKGLEFDAVLVCNADNAHYSTADDKRLLYISCTRALHRLSLFYTGEVSPLLK